MRRSNGCRLGVAAEMTVEELCDKVRLLAALAAAGEKRTMIASSCVVLSHIDHRHCCRASGAQDRDKRRQKVRNGTVGRV